jgi:hypothetical protein
MRLLALLCLLSAPVFAQSYSTRDRESSMEGLYAALGGGGQFLITDGAGNGGGYDLEARLGYSFGPGMQLYLSGSADGATLTGDISIKLITLAANLQYHLIARGPVMAYTRFGIGLGMVPNLTDTETGMGLAESGGIGMEIRLSDQIMLAPELFYRRANVSATGVSGEFQTIGLQLALAFY